MRTLWVLFKDWLPDWLTVIVLWWTRKIVSRLHFARHIIFITQKNSCQASTQQRTSSLCVRNGITNKHSPKTQNSHRYACTRVHKHCWMTVRSLTRWEQSVKYWNTVGAVVFSFRWLVWWTKFMEHSVLYWMLMAKMVQRLRISCQLCLSNSEMLPMQFEFFGWVLIKIISYWCILIWYQIMSGYCKRIDTHHRRRRAPNWISHTLHNNIDATGPHFKMDGSETSVCMCVVFRMHANVFLLTGMRSRFVCYTFERIFQLPVTYPWWNFKWTMLMKWNNNDLQFNCLTNNFFFLFLLFICVF